jgi:deferrochelatase/peroxidase EfeB
VTVSPGTTSSKLTRKDFVARAALTAAGAYALVDELSTAPARAAVQAARKPAPPPLEQHLIRGLRTVTRNKVKVLIPPRHHQLVTAKLAIDPSPAALREAQRELAAALGALDRSHPVTPAGLSVTVGWGLPYFERFVPQLRDGRKFPEYLPLDKPASTAAGVRIPVLIPAFRFDSDDPATRLEVHDVVFHFRSDALEHVSGAADELFRKLDGVFTLTSIRKGFVGGGLPKQMATAVGLAGADKIPEGAQLFMGFTSTQRSALAPGKLANFESMPGFSDQWPKGYFRNGTTMHVSHLFEDLERWYALSYQEQLRAVGRPGLKAKGRRFTLPMEAQNAESQQQVVRDVRRTGTSGHSGAIQAASRLERKVYDNYGQPHKAGTSLIQRADFNSLDNPFFWTSDPVADRQIGQPAASLHFVAFSPSSTMFHWARYAMEGRFRDGTRLGLDPRAPEQGFNSVLRTTHRQNYLVPGRARRSFPLAELLPT